MKKEMRMSATVYNLWKRGEKDKALMNLRGIKTAPTFYMRFGSAVHTLLENQIKNMNLPPQIIHEHMIDLGIWKKGSKIVAEPKMEKPVNDWLTLVGKIDAICGDSVIEFKTGFTDNAKISNYTNSDQGLFYALMTGKRIVDYFLFKFDDFEFPRDMNDFVSQEDEKEFDFENIIFNHFTCAKIHHSRRIVSEEDIEEIRDKVSTIAAEIRVQCDQYGQRWWR